MPNETLEEALEAAGSRVLTHLGSKAHKLTWDEVRDWEEDNHLSGEPLEGEHRAYAGPYTDIEDGRNSWTAYQDMGVPTAKNSAPAEEDEEESA